MILRRLLRLLIVKMGIMLEAPDIDLLSFVFENEGGNQDKPVNFSAMGNMHVHR